MRWPVRKPELDKGEGDGAADRAAPVPCGLSEREVRNSEKPESAKFSAVEGEGGDSGRGTVYGSVPVTSSRLDSSTSVECRSDDESAWSEGEGASCAGMSGGNAVSISSVRRAGDRNASITSSGRF